MTTTSSRRKKQAGGPRKILEKFPTIEGLEFGKKLGQGHFSEVYQGEWDKGPAAIKVIERGSQHLIQTEIELLEALKGLPHIVQLFKVFKTETTILVFELVRSLDIDDFFDELDSVRLKFIIRALLEATKGAHSKGIVHRDIKMGNIMVSHDFKDLKLIDWGCGARISTEMSPKAGSRTCRSPEMLLGYKNYGTGCDAWAIGTFIVYILTDSIIPWKAKTSDDALISLSKIYGSEPFIKLAAKYNIVIEDSVVEKMCTTPKRTIESYFDKNCEDLIDPRLVDLVKKLLVIDPDERCTIQEALDHPYFMD